VSRVDDYAWLHDPHDPEAVEYLRAEAGYAERATAGLAGLADRLHEEILGRMPAADASVTWRRHGVVYFTRTRRGDRYERLCRYDDTGTEERLVLDPNALVKAGYAVGVGMVEPSPDGRLAAYLVYPGTAAGPQLRFRDTETGFDLADRVDQVSGTGAWSADSRHFLYTAPDRFGRAHEVRLHPVGGPPDADEAILVESDPAFRLTVGASRDGRWLVIQAASRESTEVHLVDSAEPTEPPRLVAARRPGIEYSVEPMPGGWDGADEDLLLVVSNDAAPEFRLFSTPVPPPGGKGDPADWTAVRGLPGGDRLESALTMQRHVVLVGRQGGEPFLRVVDRPAPGEPLPPRPVTREVHPGIPHGRLRLWHADDPEATTVVMVEENLVTAPAWVAVDLFTGARSVIKRMPVQNVDPTRYATQRLFATAPDGVRIPVTIAHRRDARRGRTAGLLLVGHGAFEHCSWPAFDPATLSLLDRGMVVAVAHVRGGGELGRAWWLAGRRRSKQRTFVDYVAVRDALVAAGWAGEVRGGARVVSRGRHAGGLLQAAVYSQAPRMWRAVVAEVPFVDVVTAMSDPTLPETFRDRAEWGDPEHDAEDFAAMLAWSPYDNPPPPGRPALLVTAAPRDPRVRLHEPLKWVARLRATDDPRTPSPLLLRVEDDLDPAGPGTRHEAAVLAWVLHQLDLE
jgi:oligopeptidase B